MISSSCLLSIRNFLIVFEMITLVSWTLLAKSPTLRYRAELFLYLFSLKQHHFNSALLFSNVLWKVPYFSRCQDIVNSAFIV